jgi:hypothetical protein
MPNRFPLPWCEHGARRSPADCAWCLVADRTRIARELYEEVEAILPPEIAEAYRDENPWLGDA